MKRLKNFLTVSLIVFALTTTITLCGGGGSVHPVIDTIIYNII